MITIAQSNELMHRAKTKIDRAKRNHNVHEDIAIMDELVSLVEHLKEALRNTAAVTAQPEKR